MTVKPIEIFATSISAVKFKRAETTLTAVTVEQFEEAVTSVKLNTAATILTAATVKRTETVVRKNLTVVTTMNID